MPDEMLEKFIKDKINEFTTRLEADPDLKLAIAAHLARVNFGAIVQHICEKKIEEMIRVQAQTISYDGKTKKAMHQVSEMGRREEGGIKGPAKAGA